MPPPKADGNVPSVRAITVSKQSLGSELMHKGQNMFPCMLPEVENALDGQTASQPQTSTTKGEGKRLLCNWVSRGGRPVLVDNPGSRADPSADQRR